MNMKDTLELTRKWVIFAVTVLLVPMIKLTLHNQQLIIEQNIRANYWSRAEHIAWTAEHKEWTMQERERLIDETKKEAARIDKLDETVKVELRSINTKLDAAILNLNTLQLKIGTLEQKL